MNIQQLTYTLKVLECGSITKAAQELDISQPTITKAVSGLEKEYSIKIFERHNKGIILTQEGKKFLSYAKNITYNTKMLDTIFKNNNVGDKAQLLVATQNVNYISDVFVEIYKKHSEENLEFELHNTHRENIIESVKRGSYNIGILGRTNREAKRPEWNLENMGLEEEVIDTSWIYVYVGEKNKLYNKKVFESEDMEGMPNICVGVSERSRNIWKIYNQYKQLNLDKAIYSNSFELGIKMIRDSEIVLFGTKWHAKYFENMPIRGKRILDNEDISELICITRKGEALSIIELEFIDRIKQVANIRKSKYGVNEI